MINKIKALALGNYTDVKYHPFAGVDRELEAILAEIADVKSTGEYNVLSEEGLAEYELFISYMEFSDKPLDPFQVAALLRYVANGGGLLVVHNGISLQRNQELMTMLGAKFTGHPPFTALPISNVQANHPIMKDIESFVIEDEPYRFEILPHFKTTILAEYQHDGQQWPAAWAHEYGLGKVVYLMNGHRLSCFSSPSFRRMLKQAALWAGTQATS